MSLERRSAAEECRGSALYGRRSRRTRTRARGRTAARWLAAVRGSTPSSVFASAYGASSVKSVPLAHRECAESEFRSRARVSFRPFSSLPRHLISILRGSILNFHHFVFRYFFLSVFLKRRVDFYYRSIRVSSQIVNRANVNRG